jgi:hypothetical protein
MKSVIAYFSVAYISIVFGGIITLSYLYLTKVACNLSNQ